MPDRHWACGLLRVHKDWATVLRSDDYRKIVQPLYDSVPELAKTNCQDWPEGPVDPNPAEITAYSIYRDKSVCVTCQDRK